MNNYRVGRSPQVDHFIGAANLHLSTDAIGTNRAVAAVDFQSAANIADIDTFVGRADGSIVFVSSCGAFRGEPAQPAYGASKAGMNALSQSLAKRLAPHNIFAGTVAPGFVATDMGSRTLSPEEQEASNGDARSNAWPNPRKLPPPAPSSAPARFWM